MKNKGFTLVEMLVAIGIFSIFMGVLMTSYMSIVKGLRGAEEYRQLYADSRHVFDTILENARNSTVYGACNSVSDEGFGSSDLNTLSFCSTDGGKKVTFEYTAPVVVESSDDSDGEDSVDEIGTLTMTTEEKANLLVDESGYAFPEESVLNSDGVSISSFSFRVFPTNDPFSSKYDGIPYQPVVIVQATFEKESVSGSTYSMPLQTAISLRTYN